MQLRSKKALDYYLGRPILVVLYPLARILGAILGRSHDRNPVRSILVVKFQGLGSLVIAKPALAELRRQLPNAKMVFWGTRDMKALADQMPEFDEVLVLDDRTILKACGSTMAALIRIWRERFDWAIDLEVYSRLSSVLVTLSSARNRTGFALEQIRSRRVHTHLIYFNRLRYTGEAYARIIGQVLPSGSTVDLTNYGTWRFDMDPLPGVPPKYFVFNIHAGDLAPERRWPREYFSRLIGELLILSPDAFAYLIGHGASEVEYSSFIGESDRVRNLAGKLSLSETVRLIANAHLVVSNDTAALHFAVATRTRLVGLFGPTRGEIYVREVEGRVSTAQIELYCSPCVHNWEPVPCRGDNLCMKQLTVSRVLGLCCDLLGLPARPLAEEPLLSSDYYPGLVYKRSKR